MFWGKTIIYLTVHSASLHLGAYTANLSKVVEKSTKVHATRPESGLGYHLNFAYWPRGNVQVCIFAREEYVYPLRRGLSL